MSASPVRLRAVSLPQRRRGARARQRPVLLPAQDESPPRGAALERRLPLGAGRGRHPARLDPRDGADRDDLGRVRDGRDPVRAARARRGAQRRPLGLHLQCHQEVPRRTRDGAARSRAGDDGRAVHARLHRAAGEDVPSPRRARDRRHGGVHPQPARAGGHREGPRARCARTRSARAATASTARGSPTRTSCRSRWRSSTASWATGPTRRIACARTSQVVAAELLDFDRRRRRGHRGRRPRQRPVALRYIDSWLRGTGAAAIDNLMEDAATAEISRSQLWQWITQRVALDDGRPFDAGSLRRDPRRGDRVSVARRPGASPRPADAVSSRLGR